MLTVIKGQDAAQESCPGRATEQHPARFDCPRPDLHANCFPQKTLSAALLSSPFPPEVLFPAHVRTRKRALAHIQKHAHTCADLNLHFSTSWLPSLSLSLYLWLSLSPHRRTLTHIHTHAHAHTLTLSEGNLLSPPRPVYSSALQKITLCVLQASGQYANLTFS